MLPGRASLLVPLLFATLIAAACANPADDGGGAADRPAAEPRVVMTAESPTTTTRPKQPGVTVSTQKRVPAMVDCLGYVSVVTKATGVRASLVEDESTHQLCRYRLPYAGPASGVSVLFRAEPPGTPSYRHIEEIYGNTAYRVGEGDGEDSCGLSVALDPYLEAHEHGSHLTVLGSYGDSACDVTRKILDAVFERLTDVEPESQDDAETPTPPRISATTQTPEPLEAPKPRRTTETAETTETTESAETTETPAETP
ncbi:hypothetical protein [Actinokineospora iranica]|uniref:hypothetical protein n=1 Tax=Actinokineospora iranica TaxID=1271860 RepID=UPI0011133758|nr:hypothetical protein [Actinokineospora iranica]